MAKNRLSDEARNKGRMAIYAMAGFYLLYLAYSMFQEIPHSSGNEKILMVVFTIFFVLIGGGMMVMGLYQGYKMSKKTSDAIKKMEEEKRISEQKEEESE